MIDADSRKRQALTVGLAMAVSLWVHILGLSLWHYVPPQSTAPTPLPIVFEIEPPPPAKPVEAKPQPAEQKQPVVKPAPELPPPQPAAENAGQGELPSPGEEETISLESRDPKFAPYLGLVKVNIDSRWIWPPEARKNPKGGRLRAVFTLDRLGRLIKIVVQESSGNNLLDHAALEAVRGAAPFPPFPEHLGQLQRLNINAVFNYQVRTVNVK